jgi:positive regulator of sigma E activity
MKNYNLVYLFSLIALTVSIYLILEYRDSQRIQSIAGILIFIGFAMNIVGFIIKKRQ